MILPPEKCIMDRDGATVLSIFGAIVAYVIYKERQALGCPSIPTGEDCNNAEGKAVKDTKPYPTDSTKKIFQKINRAADFADHWVVWRLSFLLSIPCVVMTSFFLHNRLPDRKELIVGIFVITCVVYFVINFYKFHMINHARNHIVEGVAIIEQRVSTSV